MKYLVLLMVTFLFFLWMRRSINKSNNWIIVNCGADSPFLARIQFANDLNGPWFDTITPITFGKQAIYKEPAYFEKRFFRAQIMDINLGNRIYNEIIAVRDAHN